jgi:hypothetical protein
MFHGICNSPNALRLPVICCLGIAKTITDNSQASAGTRHFQFRLDDAFVAVWTDSVRELRLGVFRNVGLHLLPIVPVISDPLTIRADRQQALKSLDPAQSVFQLGNSFRQGHLQPHHALTGVNSRPKLLVIEGLGDVIIRVSPQTIPGIIQSRMASGGAFSVSSALQAATPS